MGITGLLTLIMAGVFAGEPVRAAGPAGRPSAPYEWEIRPIAVVQDDAAHEIRLPGGELIHASTHPISNSRLISAPGSGVQLALWDEQAGSAEPVAHYAASLDGGAFHRARSTSYELRLRYDSFDPTVRTPNVPAVVCSGAAGEGVYIVQFVTPALDVFRRDLTGLGARIYKFLANQAYLVKMNEATRARVAELAYVRWVGPYHPAYRLDRALLGALLHSPEAVLPMRFNILVFERGPAQQQSVAEAIVALGGTVHLRIDEGFRLEATLDGGQLLEVLRMNEVWFVDRWSAPQEDMDLAREIGGANGLEAMAGFTGAGVRGEVMDGNVLESHVDFESRPLLFHGPRSGDTDHGTATTGVLFGDGRGNGMARGMLPDGQAIFADTGWLTNRYTHTAELLDAPYLAVFQSNSWGNSRTRSYTTISAEFDDILFLYDILVTQSQSNAGTRDSRPQAWAKNVVSVGGVNHFDTLDKSDDCWCEGASIGPAADGRVKPDFVHFYDSIFTLSSAKNDSYAQFCCTSGATPIVSGHFGLFFQMWHEGVFPGFGGGATTFDSRPHMTTSKATLINTAEPYEFVDAADDLSRAHQGWGMPSVANLYDGRARMLVIDESVVLSELDAHVSRVYVPFGEPALRATLVYADPMGNPAASVHRINDLSLRVTSPSGVAYWGNNGLLAGNESTAGGLSNTIDTVENVFVTNPEPGVWRVEVIADELNEDGHVETPEVDADFALVVSGVLPAPAVNADDLEGGRAPGGVSRISP